MPTLLRENNSYLLTDAKFSCKGSTKFQWVLTGATI